jgi:hypothetical protein
MSVLGVIVLFIVVGRSKVGCCHRLILSMRIAIAVGLATQIKEPDKTALHIHNK